MLWADSFLLPVVLLSNLFGHAFTSNRSPGRVRAEQILQEAEPGLIALQHTLDRRRADLYSVQMVRDHLRLTQSPHIPEFENHVRNHIQAHYQICSNMITAATLACDRATEARGQRSGAEYYRDDLLTDISRKHSRQETHSDEVERLIRPHLTP